MLISLYSTIFTYSFFHICYFFISSTFSLFFSFLCLNYSLYYPLYNFFFFFFNDPAPPEISPLSLHDALPISDLRSLPAKDRAEAGHLRDDDLVRRDLHAPGGLPAVPSDAYPAGTDQRARAQAAPNRRDREIRSEEHTSELQSPCNLVCRLLLE